MDISMNNDGSVRFSDTVSIEKFLAYYARKNGVNIKIDGKAMKGYWSQTFDSNGISTNFYCTNCGADAPFTEDGKQLLTLFCSNCGSSMANRSEAKRV